MTASVIHLLRCPVCGAACSQDEAARVLFCTGERRHSFDFAKSGYLNLCLSAKSGDTKDAVRNRSAFLEAGYYELLQKEINTILFSYGAHSVLDAGCGEGYYTNRIAADRVTLGVDLSKEGIDHAAKVAKREGSGVGFAVASLFELPVADAAFDAVINLFAPCAEDEFCRVLEPSGVLLVVGAGERHLMGLKSAIYNDPYLNQGRSDLPVGMRLCEKKRLRYEICVEGNAMIQALFSMTPYYWRTTQADKNKLNGLERLTTEVDFDIFIYRKEA